MPEPDADIHILEAPLVPLHDLLRDALGVDSLKIVLESFLAVSGGLSVFFCISCVYL